MGKITHRRLPGFYRVFFLQYLLYRPLFYFRRRRIDRRRFYYGTRLTLPLKRPQRPIGEIPGRRDAPPPHRRRRPLTIDGQGDAGVDRLFPGRPWNNRGMRTHTHTRYTPTHTDTHTLRDKQKTNGQWPRRKDERNDPTLTHADRRRRRRRRSGVATPWLGPLRLFPFARTPPGGEDPRHRCRFVGKNSKKKKKKTFFAGRGIAKKENCQNKN